jgi:hypothetical protein
MVVGLDIKTGTIIDDIGGNFRNWLMQTLGIDQTAAGDVLSLAGVAMTFGAAIAVGANARTSTTDKAIRGLLLFMFHQISLGGLVLT